MNPFAHILLPRDYRGNAERLRAWLTDGHGAKLSVEARREVVAEYVKMGFVRDEDVKGMVGSGT